MPAPIKRGGLDGYPCVFTHREAWMFGADDTWHRISVTEAVCQAALLSEQVFQRNFGHYDLPPLPMHAFQPDGWLSPLV